MTFDGIKDARQRADLLAFLKQATQPGASVAQQGGQMGSMGGMGGMVGGGQVPNLKNGVSKMRELKSVDIEPNQTIEFRPGGSHVMFVGLKHPLSQGEHAKGTLIFEHAGTVQIEYDVQGIGAQSGPQQMEQMSH
jgi:Copper chaperone PCu(A)C